MFNILIYKGDANQNDTRILSYPSHWLYQQNKQQQMQVRMQGKRIPCTLLVGMQISAITIEISMEVPQNTKSRNTT
jgi:hypothetical protein